MMKFVSSMLVSLMLVFVLFSVFWATIFSGYIQYYGIAVFFNPFFMNVFNPYAFAFFVAIFGIGFVIPFINKLFKLLFIALLGGTLLLFIPQFGKTAGEILLSKEYTLDINERAQNVRGLYEDKGYIVYLKEDSDDFETRKRNLVYYQKPTQE